MPANRIGYRQFTGQQLKIVQEVITIAVFAVFGVFWLAKALRWNCLAATACLVAAVGFMFPPAS